MRNQHALNADNVLNILRPKPEFKTACLANIADDLNTIKAPQPLMLRERQLRNVASKANALRAAINALPEDWRRGSEDFLRELDCVIGDFTKMADTSKREKVGRNRTSRLQAEGRSRSRQFLVNVALGTARANKGERRLF